MKSDKRIKIPKDQRPTRMRRKEILDRCEAMPCIANIERVWSCADCRISSEYQKFCGIRIEEEAQVVL